MRTMFGKFIKVIQRIDAVCEVLLNRIRPNKQKKEGLTVGQSLSIIQLMRKRDYFLK